jgi:hypothetical protein
MATIILKVTGGSGSDAPTSALPVNAAGLCRYQIDALRSREALREGAQRAAVARPEMLLM